MQARRGVEDSLEGVFGQEEAKLGVVVAGLGVVENSLRDRTSSAFSSLISGPEF